MVRRHRDPLPEQLTFFEAVDDRGSGVAVLLRDDPALTPILAPPPVMLQEAQTRYQDFLLSLGRSRHTANTQRIDLRLLLGLLGNRSVSGIDVSDLRNFVAWLRTERGNDPRSLRRKVASVKGLFSFLHREGLIAQDPARPLVYPTAPARLPEVLEMKEAEAVAAVAVHHPMWRALVLMVLDAGLKRDEVLALDMADVVLDPAGAQGSAVVVRATHEAQTVRPRRLQLTTRLQEALVEYLSERTEGAVFPLSVRAINFIVAECGRKAGISKRSPVTPQMLRDTFALTHMRTMIKEEMAGGLKDAERAAVRDQHNRELLMLLGLAENGDGALRYRILANPLPAPTA